MKNSTETILKKSSSILISFVVFGISGCTPPSKYLTVKKPKQHIETIHYEKPTPKKLTHYHNTMRAVAEKIQNDTRYQRIDLDTAEKKEWFKQLTYRLWDRQITRKQFMQEGLAKYPTHKYEFEFIIKGFESVCE